MTREQVKVGAISPRRLLTVLIGVVGLLSVMHLVARTSGLNVLEAHWFMGDEGTIPTWWSSVQLLILGVALFLLAKMSSFEPSASRLMRLLAAVFAFFSIDEAAGIHESITGVFSRFDGVPRFAGSHGVWIFAYALLAILLLAISLPGVTSMLKNHRRLSFWFVLGLAVFLLGGVGVEIVGFFGTDSRDYRTVQTLIEEALEISGVSLMVWAVYRELFRVKISFQPGN